MSWIPRLLNFQSLVNVTSSKSTINFNPLFASLAKTYWCEVINSVSSTTLNIFHHFKAAIMSKSKASLIALFLFSFIATCFCQDLHIYYDSQTENLRYVYKGKEIQRPKVSRGSSIFLHVQNYNNYLYSVEVKANETEIKAPAADGGNQFSGLLSMGGGQSPMQMLSAGGVSSTMNDNLEIGGGSPSDEDESGITGFAAKADESAQFSQLKTEYSQAVAALKQLETEIEAVREETNNEMQANQINGIVLQEIEKLKVNPDLKPEQIKKLSGEYLKKVFNVKNIGEVDLAYVLERTDTRQVLSNSLTQLKRKESTYRTESEKLKNLADLAATLNLEDSGLKKVAASIQTTYLHTQEVQQSLEEDISKMNTMLPQLKENDMQHLAKLRYEYEAIAANDFTRTYRAPVKGDATSFEVTFKLKDTTNSELQKRIQIAPIEVPAFGGFKVNASLGISFGQFSDRPQDYFIRDSTILGEDQDAFFPILTSFVHFYSQGSKNISLGASIGVGFPVVSVGNNQSIAFFGGPSLIVGKSDRLVISGGIMGGKVQRLGQGYQVEDVFTADAGLIPKKERYELGYFLGMSYNLTK